MGLRITFKELVKLLCGKRVLIEWDGVNYLTSNVVEIKKSKIGQTYMFWR